MTKQELINQIRIAFKNQQLEDGIGIWEASGIDDLADKQTLAAFRKKDERNNWENIPFQHLADCENALSFLDAKGMRFCLPRFLIFSILEEEISQDEQVVAPDLLFTLKYRLDDDYQENRFSLFNNQQIQCIVDYLEYRLSETARMYKEYGAAPETINADPQSIELIKAIEMWKKKLL